MKYSAALSLATIAVGVSAQGVPSGIAPPGGSPPGCQLTVPGKYAIQNVKVAAKRDLEKRAVDCSAPGTLVVQINNGIMTDSAGRIAEIVANRQFQFDGPPAQTGSIYTGGWSMCANDSLAIGPTTVFYQCLSGSFSNIYDQSVGAQCQEIHQQLLLCADSTGTSPVSVSSSASSSSSSAAAPTTVANTTTTSSSVVTSVSSATSATTTAVVSQITDGQPQATTAAPIHTGAASQFAASGAVVALGAVAAYFL